LGNGKFAAREVIRDRSGKPILKVPDQKDRVESFGTWMALVDWYGRGVLDILVGTFEGTMFLRKNDGTRTKPLYATENEWVMVADKRLRVPGGEHANPVIVDWDGDGLWDIVSGSGEGGVYWYRNIGKRGQPCFAPPVALVPKHEGGGYSEILDAGHEPRPGIRTQIAVVDYDGDGKLDLLVGDFCTYLHVKQDLEPDERRTFEALKAKQDDAGKPLREDMEALQKRWKTLMKDVPKSEWNTKENMAKWQKMYEAMRNSAEHKKHMADYEALQKDMLRYVKGPASRPGSPDTPHGYVWLFRRK
jgi:hypothetical protein